METKYKATCPDGTVLKRTTNRVYTHVLAIKSPAGKWGQFGWIGRPDLISAKKREAERMGYPQEDMMVLPAEKA